MHLPQLDVIHLMGEDDVGWNQVLRRSVREKQSLVGWLVELPVDAAANSDHPNRRSERVRQCRVRGVVGEIVWLSRAPM